MVIMYTIIHNYQPLATGARWSIITNHDDWQQTSWWWTNHSPAHFQVACPPPGRGRHVRLAAATPVALVATGAQFSLDQGQKRTDPGHQPQPPAQLSHLRVYRAGPAQSSAGLAQISWGLVGLNTCPSSLLPRLYSSLSALSCYIIIQ